MNQPVWPVVVGFGGVDAGGRWGGPTHPAFGAILNDGLALPPDVAVEQLRLMERVHKDGDDAFTYRPDGTIHSAASLAEAQAAFVREHLFVRRGEDGRVSDRAMATGAIPAGFLPCPEDAPGPARKKVARNLWLALWATCDALKTAGLTADEVSRAVPPDAVGVYFGSAMGQLCAKGAFGYMKAHLNGGRPETTQIAFSLNSTPAAFVAAYTAGSLGHISCEVGACATFMVNLYNAMRDIQLGVRRFAIVGAADAPLLSWVLKGYEVMKATARDADLPTDEQGQPQYRRASRPFAQGRSGFVPGEGAFTLLLTDRALALELGLPARGLVLDVCCRSDGWKKSITKPGVGDYAALQSVLRRISRHLGVDVLRRHSFVSAHGSSTPQNGVTEAKLYRDYAETFGIPRWPVTALKSFMGHAMGPAGGLQSACGLLSMEQGVIPKIRNLAELGLDPELAGERLEFLEQNQRRDPGDLKVAIAVSKGFGGFNAVEALAGPALAQDYLFSGSSEAEQSAYAAARESRAERAAGFQEAYLGGAHMVDYDSSRPLSVDQLTISGPEGLEVEGYAPFGLEP